MRYGFVGLGRLGGRLARLLLDAGFEVSVSDLDNRAGAPLVEAGASWAASPAEAAAGADGLITCLPNPNASTQALTGSDGALPAMKKGSTWIEMSTTDIDELKRIASMAHERGVDVLECPVTGGLHRAERGEMTVFVGGDADVLARHRPAFDAMCGPLFHLGELGTASLLKVITNMLCMIDLVAAGEALMLAKKGGLDLGQCYDAICASSGSSREFEDWAPVILNGSFKTGFTLDLALKDMGFGMGLGKHLDVPLKLSGLVEQLLVEARSRHGGKAWTPNVIGMMEQAGGVELRADGFENVID